MDPMDADDHYLTCMVQSMGHIRQVARQGLSSLMESVAARDATLWNIYLVSRAARRISDERKKAHPEIDWEALAMLSRNIIGDPWSVDVGKVGEYVENQLPDLRERLQRVLVNWAK